MAKRPVYIVSDTKPYCKCKMIDFEYSKGTSIKQKQKNIKSLHEVFMVSNPNSKILEISSKSENPLGVALSAFNLMVKNKNGEDSFSVEAAFQASKVFEKGGPYTDLLYVSSKEAKKDKRLKTSGSIIGFNFQGEEFISRPKTFFYSWLYINALISNKELAEAIMDFDAFTDIEFNPQKSLNCQAEAVALFVALKKNDLLEKALKDKNSFRQIVYFVD